MGKPKTVEERVGILEQGKEDCQKLQAERYNGLKEIITNGDKESMKQIDALKTKLNAGAVAIIVVVLTTLANIGVMILSMWLKK